MRKLKRLAIGTLVTLGIAGVLAWSLVLPAIGARIDTDLNRTIERPTQTITDRARALHQLLRVADLHADPLLWQRDLLQRNDRGHSDLPRLREGRFALQVFSAVTKSPRGLNYESNAADSLDNITLLALAQHWPTATWRSLHQRALFQAERLHSAAKRSADLTVVTTPAELQTALAANQLAGILAIEGSHPLEGDLANLEPLVDAGYRVFGLQHFFDNELGGSLHGSAKSGLTEFGRRVVQELDRRGMIIDLAHSSEATVRDVLALSKSPMIISHTGIKSVCDTPRNISDELMRDIANRGGLIGIGFWDAAVCDPTPAGIAKVIKQAIELLGTDRIALGSDFDGAVTTTFDASEMIALTQALLEAGLTEREIHKVMGENAMLFFARSLPRAG